MIGETISHYRILEELGRGGMCLVYKIDPILDSIRSNPRYDEFLKKVGLAQ